jgi:hypothetical protein
VARKKRAIGGNGKKALYGMAGAERNAKRLILWIFRTFLLRPKPTGSVAPTRDVRSFRRSSAQ